RIDEARAVAPDPRQIRRDVEGELELAAFAGRLEGADRLFDDRAWIVLLELEDAASALHSAPIEQPIDEGLEPGPFLVQRLDAAVFVACVAPPNRERFGEHADRRERSAELVRYLGDEIGLELGQIALTAEKDPDEDDPGRQRAAERQHEDPHQEVIASLA